MVSGSDWYTALANPAMGTVSVYLPGDTHPQVACKGEFIVRHEDPSVEPITVYVIKTAPISPDSDAILAEDKNLQATGVARAYLETWDPRDNMPISSIDLAFYSGDVKYKQYGFEATDENGKKYTYDYEGKGELIHFTLYDVPNVTDISTTTFTIDPKLGKYDSKYPYAILAGTTKFSGNRIVLRETFYTRIDNDFTKDEEYAPLKSGSVTVSKEGDNYKFEWEFYTDNGHSVSGSYTGPIEWTKYQHDYIGDEVDGDVDDGGFV